MSVKHVFVFWLCFYHCIFFAFLGATVYTVYRIKTFGIFVVACMNKDAFDLPF